MELKEQNCAKLEFEDLEFHDEGEKLKVSFLKNFFFELEKEELESLADFSVEGKTITFQGISEKKARNKFNILLDKGLSDLTSSVTKKPTAYIHQYSGIPLIGSNSFGIIDRNTNIIEVKPLTGCNENCNYCSVDEGLRSKKTSEVVIEKDYLVKEFEKLVKFKECEVEAYINSHGEPALYGPLPELVRDLNSIENVRGVVMNSNGSMLDNEYIDRLAKAGLKRLNLSLNALDPQKAKIISGWGKYDIEKVKRMAAYAAKKIELLLAPVWVPGFNDEEIPKIVQYSLEIGAKIGIQNFLYYKRGRNPTQPMPWEQFYEKLNKMEKDFGINLTKMDLKDEFKIMQTKKLPKPFKKGQYIEAEIKLQGRYPKEKIAVARERNITILNCEPEKGTVRAKLIRDKHNVFTAVMD